MLLIGTSFVLEPDNTVIPRGVPRINISKTLIDHVTFEIQLVGDCDEVTASLCQQLKWPLKTPKGRVQVVRRRAGAVGGTGTCSWEAVMLRSGVRMADS